jgi:hypothetical protein
MNWFQTLFCCCLSPKKTYIDSSVNLETFTSAGVFFTNNIHVLVGEQNDIHNTVLSGIGGKKEYGESYMDTALREMIEELFDNMHVPKELIKKLKKLYKPQMVFQVYTYISVVYSFDDLESMLHTIAEFGLKSRVYETIPLTINTLIENRILTFDSEIKNITILSISLKDLPFKPIHSNFIYDVQKYKKLQEELDT